MERKKIHMDVGFAQRKKIDDLSRSLLGDDVISTLLVRDAESTYLADIRRFTSTIDWA